MSTDSDRLYALFKERSRVSQAEFGKLYGIGSQGMVSQYLRGFRPLNLRAAERFARGLGVSIEDFSPDLAQEASRAASVSTHVAIGQPSPTVEVVPVSLGARRVPLISYVQAGAMTEMVASYPAGFALDWLLTDLELSEGAFALEIQGDSMTPDFRPGDRIIVDPNIKPGPGDFVVAKNGDHEATFKKYRPRRIDEKGEEVFELVPLNDDYPTMYSDVTPIRIIGTMVEHRRYRRR